MAANQYFLSQENEIGLQGGMRLWVQPGGDNGPTTLTSIGLWANADPWLNSDILDPDRDPAGFAQDQRSGVGTARVQQPGRAANFFNSNYINVGDTGETVKSISFWVKPDAILARTDGVFRLRTTANNVEIVNGTVTTDSATDAIRVDDVDTAVIPDTTQWHHVYIEFTTAQDLDGLLIGREETAHMDGKLFDCRFYSRALGAPEITAFTTQKDTPQYPVDLPDDHEVGYYLDECFTVDNGAYQNGSTTNIAGNASNWFLEDATTYYEGNDVPYSIQNLYGYTIDLDFLTLDPDDLLQTNGNMVVTPRVAGEDLVMTGAVSDDNLYWVDERFDTIGNYLSIESTSIGFKDVTGTPLFYNSNASQFIHVPGTVPETRFGLNNGGQSFNRWLVSSTEAVTCTEWRVRLTCPLPLLASDRTKTALTHKDGVTTFTPIPAQFTGVCAKRVVLTDTTPPDSDTVWMNGITDTALDITTGEITMFGWLWSDDASVRNICGAKSNCYRFMDLQTNGDMNMYVGNGSSQSNFNQMGKLPLAQWCHVLWHYDGSNGNMQVFVNGVMIKDKTNVSGRMSASNTNAYYPNSFDANAGGGNYGWFGGACGLGIMDRKATLAEVRDIYHNNVLPSDGSVVSYFPVSEGGGVDSYNTANGDLHTDWTGIPTWGANGVPGYHNYNTIHGCSLYEHASLQDIYVPYGDDGAALVITPPTGYTKTADYPAVVGVNTTQVALNFNPEPLAPWTRESDSIPTAWVKGDGDVSGLTVVEAAGTSGTFELGEYSDP